MSVPIIVDEWIFQDLAGKNGADKQVQAIQFLYKLEEICDQIVFLEGSPFEEKMNSMMASEDTSVRFKNARKTFIDLIKTNSLKNYPLGQADIKVLPEDYTSLVKDSSDFYLFQIYRKLQSKGCFILTTDGRWDHAKLKKKGVKIEMRDSFIPQYIQ